MKKGEYETKGLGKDGVRRPKEEVVIQLPDSPSCGQPVEVLMLRGFPYKYLSHCSI